MWVRDCAWNEASASDKFDKSFSFLLWFVVVVGTTRTRGVSKRRKRVAALPRVRGVRLSVTVSASKSWNNETENINLTRANYANYAKHLQYHDY